MAHRALLYGSQGWRANAVGLTKRYLDEGLQDRAATRDIDWGVDVPIEGFENKKIYVWLEAVLGYLSGCKEWCSGSGIDFDDMWDSASRDLRHYYVHGKDNIPFHTVILPVLLLAHGGLKLPDIIISSEYETLEGRKISTSGNWAVWVPYLLTRYQPDSIRYFFIANGPERKDSDFSWEEFVNGHNSDLLGQFGNLVNRTLIFIKKSFGLKIPTGRIDSEIQARIEDAYRSCGEFIEQGSFRDAFQVVFSLVRFTNKYFDEEKPWITIKEIPENCASVLFNCVQIISNLSVLFEPFIPFSCNKIKEMLNISVSGWEPVYLEAGCSLGEPEILFERLDKKIASEEREKLLK